MTGGASSKHPARANDSCGCACSGTTTSDPVTCSTCWKSSSARATTGGEARRRHVAELLDPARVEAAARGQLHQAEALATLHDDVQAAVGKAFHDLDHGGAGTDRLDAVVVGIDEAELPILLQAFADQLEVARLEDVQRNTLRRKQHHPERKEPDLLHTASVRRTAHAAPTRA